MTRQARAAWWAIPLVAGLLLLLVGALIGWQTPDAVEQPPGAKAPYACGSPFLPGKQHDNATCRTSLDHRRGKAETTLVLGGVLVVLGGAIALLQRREGRDEHTSDHELRPAT